MSAHPPPSGARRRAAAVLAAAAVALGGVLVLAARPAGAATTFTFNGAGWGHGIGLSQYGALGLAEDGWGAPRIVRHFYRGSRVVKRDPPKASFRVGLLQNRRVFDLTASSGGFELKLASGTVVDTVDAGDTRRVIVTKGQRFRVRRADGSVVGGKGTTWGGADDPLRANRTGGGVIRVEQWGHRQGRGFLRFHIVGPQKAHLVAVVEAEEYLYGLGEVPSSWPQAALRAQAIAARTFGYRTVAGGRGGCACDILGDVRDQAYVGWDKETGTDGERWVAAVDATARKVAVFGGELITAFYSSSSGGFTENIENVWVGATPQPYLRGVCDPGDYVAANPNRTWSVTMTARQAGAKLAAALGWNVKKVTGFSVTRRGVSGRVVLVTVNGKTPAGADTSLSTTGWDLRNALGLKETRFWVNANRNVTGAIRNAYDALNCRPGLATSAGKGIAGGRWQKFESGRMYLHRGRDAVTWVRGAILEKYVSLKAHRGFLGLPFAWKSVAGGKRARFDGGEIYWKKGVGAFEVHGAVLARYLKAGGAPGDLGFPTSDVVTLANGKVRATFQGGRITCAPAGGSCTVKKG